MASRNLEVLGPPGYHPELPCVPNPPPPPHKPYVPTPPPPPHMLAPPPPPHVQYIFPMPPAPPSNHMSPWAVVALVLLGLLVIALALAALIRCCLIAQRQREAAAAADEEAMRRPGSLPGVLRRSELRSAPPPHLRRYVLPGTSGSTKNPPPSNSRQSDRSIRDILMVWVQRD